MAKTSFNLDDELDEWIESRLAYGQAKGAFLRYCVETMQQVEPVLDQLYERYQYDERSELIEKAVIEKIERMDADSRSSTGNGG